MTHAPTLDREKTVVFRVAAIPIASLSFAAAQALAVATQDGTSTAGFARPASVVARGEIPRPEEIVVADFVNWRRHALPMPKAGEPVALDVRFAQDVARVGDEVLLQVGIATARPLGIATLPPLDLVVVVDCSGSMADAGKMDRVHVGLARLVDAMRAQDRLAFVAYDDTAWVVRPLVYVGDRGGMHGSIDELVPRGSTNLHAGLMLGYRLAASADDGERARTRRVLLLTDGIANSGVVDPSAILCDARPYNAAGIDLATIGVGADLNDDLLRSLARGGRGLYHFVGSSEDLEKVFVDDLQSLLAPVARHARLEVELPAGLALERVISHQARRTRRGFEMVLDDLNAGLTEVVLASVRVVADGRTCERRDLPVVLARLRFEEVEHGRANACETEGRLEVTAERTQLQLDPEVLRNGTIATLAEVLHDAAAAARCDGDRERARRLLRSAIEIADVRFPRHDDADVERVARVLRDALRSCELR